MDQLWQRWVHSLGIALRIYVLMALFGRTGTAEHEEYFFTVSIPKVRTRLLSSNLDHSAAPLDCEGVVEEAISK
jgi:hypothetical protein